MDDRELAQRLDIIQKGIDTLITQYQKTLDKEIQEQYENKDINEELEEEYEKLQQQKQETEEEEMRKPKVTLKKRDVDLN